MYEQIKTKHLYNQVLASGMFWEFYPELTGEWIKKLYLMNLYNHEAWHKCPKCKGYYDLRNRLACTTKGCEYTYQIGK